MTGNPLRIGPQPLGGAERGAQLLSRLLLGEADTKTELHQLRRLGNDFRQSRQRFIEGELESAGTDGASAMATRPGAAAKTSFPSGEKPTEST